MVPYFYLISYALFSSRQFISVVGGFVSFSPLIAHLFVSPLLVKYYLLPPPPQHLTFLSSEHIPMRLYAL